MGRLHSWLHEGARGELLKEVPNLRPRRRSGAAELTRHTSATLISHQVRFDCRVLSRGNVLPAEESKLMTSQRSL